MNQHHPPGRHRRGFTLTEVAIVLTIVGLLLTMLLPLLGAQLDQRNVHETRQALAEAQEALIGFAVANGRLPRPATSAVDGAEAPVACASETACTGFLPWQTLGVRHTDGWGKLLRYSVTPAFANAGFTLATPATKKLQSRDGAGNLVYQVGNASACSAANPCAPAVVYSAGKNNWGTRADGTAVGDASATNADEDRNDSATTLFIVRTPAAAGAGGEFDDLVGWLPTTVLFNRMVAAGRLP